MANSQVLLAILQQYAKTQAAKNECSKIYNQLVADGQSNDEIVRVLAGIIYDGLTYGNWPWAE